MAVAKRQGKLFVLSGPSGTGKGTICSRILERYDSSQLTLSTSMTTRSPREGEIDGVSYYFSTKEQFLKTVEEGGLLEYAEIYGNYYGTPKADILRKISEGTDVILEIEMQGAMQIKESIPDAVFVYILPPSLAELKARIVGRGTETEEAVEMRMSTTLSEIDYIFKYDYFIINDNLDDAVNTLDGIMRAEHSQIDERISDLVQQYKEEK